MIANGHVPLVNAYVAGVFVLNGQDERSRLVANATISREAFLRRFMEMDTRRNVAQECGWPDLNSVTPQQYQDLFDGFSIANRVVEVFPKECWQSSPNLYETEEADDVTEFEAVWDALGKQLRGGFHKQESGSPLWEYLLRADILSGIGRYGVILLGLDDGLPLDQPVQGWPVDEGESALGTDAQYYRMPAPEPQQAPGGTKKGRKLLYLRVFPESLAFITRRELRPTSPRFGQPVQYLITFDDPNEQSGSGVGALPITANVHWSRVVHIADNLQSSEVFGRPRMQPVLYNLLDLRKVYGSDAEAYWKNCLLKLLLESDADAQVDLSSARNAIENFTNSLQPYLGLPGFKAKTVAPAVVDPTAHVNAQIEAICIKLGCPVRVFKGSERGELASSQDDASWNDRLRSRQNGYLTPRVIAPFVDRLIQVGVLPEPAKGTTDEPGGYCIEWPDLDSLTDKDKATIALTNTQADAAYVTGGVEALIAPVDYLTRVRGFSDEEAQSIVDNRMAAHENMDTLTIPPQTAGMDVSPPPGTAQHDQQQAKQQADAARVQALQEAGGNAQPVEAKGVTP